MVQIHRKLPCAVAGQFMAAWAGKGAYVSETRSSTEFIEPSSDEACPIFTMFADKLGVVGADFGELLLPEGDVQNAALEYH